MSRDAGCDLRRLWWRSQNLRRYDLTENFDQDRCEPVRCLELLAACTGSENAGCAIQVASPPSIARAAASEANKFLDATTPVNTNPPRLNGGPIATIRVSTADVISEE